MSYIEYLELVLSILIERGEGAWLCECNNAAYRPTLGRHHSRLKGAISDQTKEHVFITTPLRVARNADVSIEEGYVYRQYIMRRFIGSAKADAKLKEKQHG